MTKSLKAMFVSFYEMLRLKNRLFGAYQANVVIKYIKNKYYFVVYKKNFQNP